MDLILNENILYYNNDNEFEFLEMDVSLSTRQNGGSSHRSQTSTWRENKSVNSSLAENIWHPRGLELQHWLLEMVITETDIYVPMTYWEIFGSDISSEATHTVSENLSLWLKKPSRKFLIVYNKLDRGIWADVLVISWSGNRTLILYAIISWQQSMTNELAVRNLGALFSSLMSQFPSRQMKEGRSGFPALATEHVTQVT